MGGGGAVVAEVAATDAAATDVAATDRVGRGVGDGVPAEADVALRVGFGANTREPESSDPPPIRPTPNRIPTMAAIPINAPRIHFQPADAAMKYKSINRRIDNLYALSFVALSRTGQFQDQAGVQLCNLAVAVNIEGHVLQLGGL